VNFWFLDDEKRYDENEILATDKCLKALQGWFWREILAPKPLTFFRQCGSVTYYLYQIMNISLAQASSGKNITPVCTTVPVSISIKQSRGSPESKECLGIDIQDQGR
jgi:hypothetical protein